MSAAYHQNSEKYRCIVMKKLFVLISVFAILNFCIIYAFASDSADLSIINNEYNSFISSLPESVKDSSPEELGNTSALKDAQNLTSWEFFLSLLGNTVKTAFESLLPMILALIAILFVSASINALSEGFDSSLSKSISFISVLSVNAAFIIMQGNILKLVVNYLSDLSDLSLAAIPVIITLYSSGGNISQASVTGGGIGIMITVIEKLFSSSVVPFFSICLSLESICALSAQLGLDGFLSLIKRTYSRFLTFTMSVFCAVLGAQSIIASASDSASLRAAKFAASSTIPVLGSSVSESMKTLSAGLGMLRKSVGVCGIIFTACLTLPTLLILLLANPTLNFAASVAEMLGCQQEKKLLRGISSLYGILTGVVAVSSLMLVFVLILLCIGSAAIS